MATEGDQDKNLQATGDEYKRMSRGKFKDLFKEHVSRCEGAAVMNYNKSYRYDKDSRNLECAAFGLGTLSMLSPGILWSHITFKKPCSKPRTMLRRLYVPVFVGVGVSIFFETVAKGDMSVRAEKHNDAGAAWQTLADKTKGHLLLVEDPKLGPHDFSRWYQDLAKESEKVSTMHSSRWPYTKRPMEVTCSRF